MNVLLLMMVVMVSMGGLVFLYLRDRRQRGRPLKDALRPEILAEMQKEKDDQEHRRRLFTASLHRAGKGTAQNSPAPQAGGTAHLDKKILER